jgi:FkbM family methyltransferase
MARYRVARVLSRLPPPQLPETPNWRRRVEPLVALSRAALGHGPLKIGMGIGAKLLLADAAAICTHVQAYGLVRGTLETPVQEAMRRLLPRGGVFFDLGANVGFFSLIGARLVGPEGKVVAFEPVPANASLVRRNAQLNGLESIDVRQVAVGAAPARAPLLVVADPSWSHLADRGWHPQTQERVEVDVVSIDSLREREEVPAPDVVKLDVEGSEGDAVRGLRRTLERDRPALICELHETNREFVDLMTDCGYVVSNLDGAEPVVEAGPVHALALPAGN